jgi:putative restriction endonuclease
MLTDGLPSFMSLTENVGSAGLMLAPHVDRLFDRGLLSFEDSGQLKVSPRLPGGTLEKWGLSSVDNVGPFTPEQSVYLSYHREHVFKS